MRPLKVLDLFSGIGGFSLGLERTGGFETVAFCEIEEFPRRVLAKHWPAVPIYDDVRTLTAERLKQDGIAADVICGGFPCQDISVAGKGEGLAGERSGLWREYARLVGELRPRYVLVENVAALLGRGLGTVLGDLAALRYDAEWHCIPASAVGAPHIRDRIWVIAYPQYPDADCAGSHRAQKHIDGDIEPAHQQVRVTGPLDAVLADSYGRRQSQHGERNSGAQRPIEGPCRNDADGCRAPLAHARGSRLSFASCAELAIVHDAPGASARCQSGRGGPALRRAWEAEPDVGRVAHGVSARVDRLRGLGNAVVPQIPEAIGRAILAFMADGAPANPATVRRPK